MAKGEKPSVIIFYHFFHPDDVVSALHKNGLALGLAKRGWSVEVFPCNRGCRDQSKTYPPEGNLEDIKITRVWRPSLNQAGTGIGRMINALWMIASWILIAFKRKPDAIIIGTDPVLSILTAIGWRLIRPRTKIAHWCFDLYPEGAISEGILKENSLFTRITKSICGYAYRQCDLIVDLGNCMRRRLHKYQGVKKIPFSTIVPWALTEPNKALATDQEERNQIGNSKLIIMYSGNLGRFHSYKEILELARMLRGEDIMFAFSVRGNAVDNLKSEIDVSDKNIKFVDFAPLEKLQERLSAAEVHMVSLREQWTGLAIPSKFFGAIAAGRPVLFSGSQDCAISEWIEEHKVGWVLNGNNTQEVAQKLKELSRNNESLRSIFDHCHKVYQREFSEEHLNDRWDSEMRNILKN